MEMRTVQESVELRLWKKNASLLLRDDEGEVLADLVRRVILPASDPRLKQVGPLSRRLRAQGDALLSSWHITRKYTKAELAAAQLLHLSITTTFEPAGEECGTTYDDSTACPVCKAGRKQIGDLRLNLTKISNSKDIASSIALVEWVVSERVAQLLKKEEVTGYELGRVVHSGRGSSVPPWHQLIITSRPVRVAATTRFGVNPFGDVPDDKAACPLGDTLGLNLLSEVHVRCESWDGSDFARTQEFVGHRLGLLMPRPIVLISPKLYRLLAQNGMRGYGVEAAYCE